MPNYYSCPSCEKTISGPFDSNSLMGFGWAAYFKEECQYCKTKVRVTLEGAVVGQFIVIFVIVAIVVFGYEIIKIIPEDLQTPLGILGLALFIPFWLFVFAVLVPLILKLCEVRLYKKVE